MIQATTLTGILAEKRKAPRALTYLEGENQQRTVGLGELYERALGILHHLQRAGVKRGDRMILHVASNEPFIDAFWAGILGGIVPVPVALGISDEHRMKLLRIARKLGNPWIYTDRRSLERVGTFAVQAGQAADFEALQQRAILLDQLDDLSRAGEAYVARPDDVAFIQFSSGSTSEPKGVVLTHGNIVVNARGAAQAADFRPDDVSLSWMPLTHDMGLIGMHIFMLASGMQVHLMPTELFIRRPLLWLQFAARVGATITSSPNFGYRHYLKVLGDRATDDLDLSKLRIVFNGAEPISPNLCEEFLLRLESTGLKRTAMYCVYGLAEASLAVSFPEPGAHFRAVHVNRHRLGVGNRIEELPVEHRDAAELMAVGRPIPYCELRIVDDADAPVAEASVGHVQIRGENVTRGYFEAPEATAAAITADGWLRTGDLGFLLEGELYISGRAKEIIFVNGQNYYPHDLEAIAIRAPGLDLGKVVTSGVRRRGAQTDELVVFVLHRMDMQEFLPTALEVARLLNEHTGLEVAEVVPVKRIPKTTSGKIQRHLLEQSYLDGEFAAELAELAMLRDRLRSAGHPTSSAIEAQLKEICDTALGGKDIGLNENLFEVGASSLKLIEIHERIDQAYPGRLDLTELLDYPTIAELAKHLERKLGN
jgi:acyl-CoA synthetase (AMP-forming)/AMP-acid ligase II/acyl carrier protein